MNNSPIATQMQRFEVAKQAYDESYALVTRAKKVRQDFAREGIKFADSGAVDAYESNLVVAGTCFAAGAIAAGVGMLALGGPLAVLAPTLAGAAAAPFAHHENLALARNLPALTADAAHKRHALERARVELQLLMGGEGSPGHATASRKNSDKTA